MKIRHITLSAGPGGVFRPGDIRDVSEDEARALITGGYAEALEMPEKPAKSAAPKTPRKKKTEG